MAQAASPDPTTTTVMLNCLVHGEDPFNNGFTVKATKNDSISELRKLVKAKTSPKFNNINYNKLNLWRVNIPIYVLAMLNHDFDFKAQGNELSPFHDIADVFPDEPSEEHLHIVVETPPEFERFTSVSTQQIKMYTAASQTSYPANFNPDKIIGTLFQDRDISALLKKLTLPNTTRHVHGHRLVKNNVIPIGPDEKADMRFYRKKLRGQSAQAAFEELERMIHDIDVIPPKIAALLGVSGCGKTSTIFELGSDYFITFFVIPPDLSENPITNSLDIKQMLKRIDEIMSKQQHGICGHFSSQQIAIDTLQELVLLEEKVLHCIETLLLARRISWSLLRLHFHDQLTPLAWLYCQEMETFGIFFETVFARMMEYNLESIDIRRCELAACMHFLNVTKQGQRFVVAIDECHRLTRYHHNRFLPRGQEFLEDNGTLTEYGRYFVERCSEPRNPFDTSDMPPLAHFPQFHTTESYRSVFPLVVQGFLNRRAVTLMILGTDLELSNLMELDSMVGKFKDLPEFIEMMEFQAFTPDDVISILRECLNQLGLTLAGVQKIAMKMEGRAHFTMGFLEYIANTRNILRGKTKLEALKKLKANHVDKIVKSSDPIESQTERTRSTVFGFASPWFIS